MKRDNRFSDTQSQYIYECLKQWGWGEKEAYLLKLVLFVYEKNTGRQLEDVIEEQKEKKIVLFGNGAIAQRICNIFKIAKFPIDYYTTNSAKYESIYHGIPYISVDEIQNNVEEYCFVIGTSIPTYIDEIRTQLLGYGIAEKQIIFDCRDIGNQYFDLEELHLTEDEVFVDAGCFNGDDVLRFKHATNQKYFKIYAFEPDKENYEHCIKQLQDCQNLEMVNAGVWSTTRELSFSNMATGSSHIEESEKEYSDGQLSNQIKVFSLDDYIGENKVTYIKMDIEGAELEALKGARNIIEKFRPKLAICVYHKAEDIDEIPEYIRKTAPFYRLYLRHYSLGELETVLYAIPTDESEELS